MNSLARVAASREGSLTRFAAEQASFNARLVDAARTTPAPGAIPSEVIRRNRREGRGGFSKPELHPGGATIEGPVGANGRPLRARRHGVGEKPTAVYLHVHGGGWTFGAPEEHDLHLAALSRATDCEVVSGEYRLAPEHVYPAARVDVQAWLEWALDHAASEYGCGLVIGGESAGAHLALCAVLEYGGHLAQEAGLIGMNLSFGFFDLGLSPSAASWGSEALVLSTPWLEHFVSQLLPGVDKSALREPAYSPLYADLSGLPPALLTVGTADPLLDDSLLLASALSDAGVECDSLVYPGAPHGFIGMPTGLARLANEHIHSWIRAVADRRGM